ncbi:hypothetical protein JY506_04685 [Corynebacterium amycolatum]|uniref:hypothetical protein n=1 Tax=Corynebacterium amycolatum TaxID=43765 RepID=UPI002119FD08|nr:hypothetical protein [Corynebacterium amycolatum]MCQ9171620.1 hypothetical protein [Corynebacterium amycolatum]
MFRRTSVLATTITSAALSLGALTGAPAATAATAAPTATTGSDDLQVKEYALSDTFSCDYYNLPWCR